MDYVIHPLTIEERKYVYAQSGQISSQTGHIGYLRGDFGSSGKEFYTSWFDVNEYWKSDDFKQEFDEVINGLRADGLLQSRLAMSEYARKNPESAFKGSYTTEYGFRVDTEQHSYLIRCNPQKGDYNLYCHCYIREYLNDHIDRARRDIRFINSDYKDLFRLPDGEQITVTDADGAKRDYTCRYIDDAHLEVGNNLYHICEFAERMERSGCTYQPKETPLPRDCMTVLQSSGEMIMIERYRMGYVLKATAKTPEENRAIADRYNRNNGISKAQEAAMVAGSMFGWDTPAAKPKNYDENGKAIKPKKKDYER